MFRRFLYPLLGRFYILLVGWSTKRRVLGEEHIQALAREGKNWIYCFWHCRLFYLSYTHRRQGIHVLVSGSRDGELIARIIERLGFQTIRGSSSRGGRAALAKAFKRLRSGEILAITPDGPRGPAEKVQGGIIQLAQKTKRPVVPVSWKMKREKRLGSWDRFVLPLPFNRAVLAYGEPFVPSSPSQLEKALKKLESELVV